MWLAKQLASAESPGAIGGKFGLNGDAPVLESGEPRPLGGMLTPYGYCGVPSADDDAAALPVDGEYLLAGAITRTLEPAPGEVIIRAAGGGYIHLQSNGEILLNGVRITPDGQIITPTV